MRKKNFALSFAVLTICCFPFPSAAQTESPLDPGKPVTVQETINAVIHRHRGIKVMQENREAIVHELDRAIAGFGPRVDVDGTYGVGVLSNNTTRNAGQGKGFYDAGTAGITLTQPLWDGWANRARVRATGSTLNSMTHRVYDNATTLGLDGLIAHIDVLRRRQIYDLSLANVSRHEDILVQTRDRESLGADTMADVSQAESRLARAMSTLVEAKAALRDSEDAYYRLTGFAAANLEPVPYPDYMYEDPKEIYDDALLSNPKLAAYVEDINAAKGEEQLSRAAYHPTVNLEIGPNYTDMRTRRDINWTYNFDVMGVLRWNIFNSGADVAGVKASQARIREARQFALNFLDDVSLEIEQTWTAYLSAQAQFKHYTDAIAFNTATRDAYQEQFILGQRSLLDVLDAESELHNSSTQAITAESNIIVGSYRLIGLTGLFLPRMNIDTSFLDTVIDDEPEMHREKYDHRGNERGLPWRIYQDDDRANRVLYFEEERPYKAANQ